MRKRVSDNNVEKITVGIYELMEMLGVGKNTADNIGRDAGAVVKIGRRKLFNVNKIQEYMDKLSE